MKSTLILAGYEPGQVGVASMRRASAYGLLTGYRAGRIGMRAANNRFWGSQAERRRRALLNGQSVIADPVKGGND